MEIKLENLVKTYNARRNTREVKAVENISLSIPSNKIFGIIGKSGAGKSTLVRLISLLETPDSGSVFYDNKRVDNISGNELIEQRRRIGMIFQNFNLFSSRTAGQNIAYPLEICGKPKAEIEKRKIEDPESSLGGIPIADISGFEEFKAISVRNSRKISNYPQAAQWVTLAVNWLRNIFKS